MTRTKTKITFDTVQELCLEKNWTSLEEEYINANHSMWWICNTCLFEWKASYSNTKKRDKCSRCKNLKTGGNKYSIKEIQKIANSKGFTLLDTEYKNSLKPLNWQCNVCDYKFCTSFSNVNRSSRKKCPKCNGCRSQYKYEEVLEVAKEKGLKCLETEYIDCNVHMKWECIKCERIWKTSFRSIVQNKGCLKCNHREVVNLTMDIVYKTIKGRNIECLDTEYVNNRIHMNWRCLICNNDWEATFGHIKDSNSGCPNCASLKSERLCRQYFQTFMGCNFPKKRPKFLGGLEYDGYHEGLQLAFEYSGIQHYKYTPHFHRTDKCFDKQQERDKKKRELSEENGVTLIEIPYEYDYREPERMEDYIMKKLIETEYIVIIKVFSE